jgi:chromosome segregation ATPase
VSELDEIRQRLDALEAQVSVLTEGQAESRRAAELFGMVDRDVADLKQAFGAQRHLLQALRDTQLEQGQAIGAIVVTLDSMQQTQRSMQGEIQSVQGEIQSVQGEIQSVQGEIQSVQGEIQSVQGEIQSVQETQRSMQGEMRSMQETQRSMQGEMRSMQETQRSMQGDLQSMRETLADHGRILGRLDPGG